MADDAEESDNDISLENQTILLEFQVSLPSNKTFFSEKTKPFN